MNKKELISNVLFCLLIGVVVAVGFTVYATNQIDKYPFDSQIEMAKHEDVKINNIDTIKPNSNGEVTIDQLKTIPQNAMLGELKYGDESVSVIYNCNDVSLIETVTLLDKGNYIGEVGCAKIYGYNANMAKIMQINVGENIEITMPYGDYVYKCVEKTSANNDWDASNKNFNVDRGLMVYSNRTDGYGFSDAYDIAMFEMVSGPKVVG